jgi:hypothetical protein
VDLSDTGTFDAEVDASADVQRAAAWVYPADVTSFPDEPPQGAAIVENPSQQFTFPDIAGAVGRMAEPYPSNTLVVWGWTGSEWSYRHDVQFYGRSQNPISVDVSAKCCLWFAWAPPASPLSEPEGGPAGEDDTYRPVALPVPSAARSAALTVGDGIWWHHDADGRRSGANGLDGTNGLPNDQRSLERQEYRSPNYNSEGITPLNAHLNKLVGIWEIGGQAPLASSPTDQVEIGQNPGSIAVPPGATKLFLGFHDGRQWTNNDGSVSVALEWGDGSDLIDRSPS